MSSLLLPAPLDQEEEPFGPTFESFRFEALWEVLRCPFLLRPSSMIFFVFWASFHMAFPRHQKSGEHAFDELHGL